MFSSSSWLHLRIPFSYFLLPVFLFSLAVSPNITVGPLLWTFIIVHFFLYPASNGFNSYFDKDEKSIGGLKHPPPVDKGLYYLSLFFDLVAIILGVILVTVPFAVMLFIYGLVSKAYSHPAIRLKKFPVTGWIVAGLFQGLFTFMMCYMGINKYSFENVLSPSVLVPGALSTVMLWANYPMTQIYQHEEDAKRGDMTFSRMLGVRGTFYFVAATFSVVMAGFVLYLYFFFAEQYAWIFSAMLFPVAAYFLFWFFRVYKDQNKADYGHTMWLNFISATCLNAFFLYLFIRTSHIAQLF
jgi:1,4-dihydroxy-2-naphthoate octaprenyltransferase